MKPINLLFIFILGFGLFSCQENSTFKDYYFQMEDFEKTKVYKFECPEIGLVEYWEMTFFPEENIFFTKMYNEELEETYFIKEKITDQGAEASAFGRSNLFAQDQGKLTLDKVLKTQVFLWDQEGPYSYQVEFKSNGEDHQLLERKRTFVDFVTVEFEGEKYKAIKFKDDFTLDNVTNEESYSYTNYSYYALGLGCVKMEMQGPNGVYRDSKLTEILTGKEWANLLSSKVSLPSNV
ncbi:hypothetical protein [Parvicella tangerina]|uniref:Lipoprotein n=1 Tax=Parvicella tangerina TaxID=2829795 RepID=A0A916NB33_9FLAO|nr:hypothetical protein [Parvicella tangerina]CAG5082093.1 hypothetical protein CRYO30217_01806 [Parvicella tangerina]